MSERHRPEEEPSGRAPETDAVPEHVRDEAAPAQPSAEKTTPQHDGDGAAPGQGRDPSAPEERDLLDDLQRVQADFANYKKRMLREQTEIASRASRSLIERLLPVLDNFELAIAHGETGGGIDLVFKELMDVLRADGLEPLESDGKPFDPTLHEAVEIHDEESVDEQTVTKTYRRGYALKGRLIRPAMVVVARPAQPDQAVGE